MPAKAGIQGPQTPPSRMRLLDPRFRGDDAMKDEHVAMIAFIASAFEVEPHRAIARRVVLPVLAHLDMQEQMHRALEHGGDLGARRFADGFDTAAAFAEHDRLLAVA